MMLNIVWICDRVFLLQWVLDKVIEWNILTLSVTGVGDWVVGFWGGGGHSTYFSIQLRHWILNTWYNGRLENTDQFKNISLIEKRFFDVKNAGIFSNFSQISTWMWYPVNVDRKLSIYGNFGNLRLTIKAVHIYVEIWKLQILVLPNLYFESMKARFWIKFV